MASVAQTFDRIHRLLFKYSFAGRGIHIHSPGYYHVGMSVPRRTNLTMGYAQPFASVSEPAPQLLCNALVRRSPGECTSAFRIAVLPLGCLTENAQGCLFAECPSAALRAWSPTSEYPVRADCLRSGTLRISMINSRRGRSGPTGMRHQPSVGAWLPLDGAVSS